MCPLNSVKKIRIFFANNVFDLQNDFHEDRLSFRVDGEKLTWVIIGLF
jgi:hypothetical protein